MVGKQVNVGGGFGGFGGRGGGRGGRGGGGGGGDSISLSITGSPADLETGFQLAYLLLTEPVIEASAFDDFKTRTKQGLEESLQNPMALGGRLVTSLTYPASDARLQPILKGSIAFVRKIDEAAACMFALQHDVLGAQGIPIQGIGRQPYRS